AARNRSVAAPIAPHARRRMEDGIDTSWTSFVHGGLFRLKRWRGPQGRKNRAPSSSSNPVPPRSPGGLAGLPIVRHVRRVFGESAGPARDSCRPLADWRGAVVFRRSRSGSPLGPPPDDGGGRRGCVANTTAEPAGPVDQRPPLPTSQEDP